MKLIPAFKKDDAFLAEVGIHQHDEQNFHLWWLGQSGYLIAWKGELILIDPYLSDSLTKKYADTNKPHIRMSERVIDPSRLGGISIVSSSHNHTDHLDAETLGPLIKNNPGIQFIIPEANRGFVTERVKIPYEMPTGLNAAGKIKSGSFTFHAVPAAHNTIERDDEGRCKFLGYVIEFDRWKIYHSGDTLLYDTMVQILKPFEVDVALLPINGNDPARGVAGNLNGQEAAQLAKAIGAKLVIPCHYDMFTFNTADPLTFITAAENIGQKYLVLKVGEHCSSFSLFPSS